MNILTYPLGELQANCYVLIEDNECLIIDPGDEGSFLLEEISRRNLTPQAIFATHGHFDHVMAVGEIQLSFDIPLYIHKDDNFLLKRVTETARYFLGHAPAVIPARRVEFLKDKKMNIGPFHFEVMSTPGHTPGGVSYYFKKEGTVFTGDTLFAGNIGRYDLSYSDKKALKKSVEKLLKLPEQTIILSGHGEETLVQSEQGVLGLFSV